MWHINSFPDDWRLMSSQVVVLLPRTTARSPDGCHCKTEASMDVHPLDWQHFLAKRPSRPSHVPNERILVGDFDRPVPGCPAVGLVGWLRGGCAGSTGSWLWRLQPTLLQSSSFSHQGRPSHYCTITAMFKIYVSRSQRKEILQQ